MLFLIRSLFPNLPYLCDSEKNRAAWFRLGRGSGFCLVTSPSLPVGTSGVSLGVLASNLKRERSVGWGPFASSLSTCKTLKEGLEGKQTWKVVWACSSSPVPQVNYKLSSAAIGILFFSREPYYVPHHKVLSVHRCGHVCGVNVPTSWVLFLGISPHCTAQISVLPRLCSLVSVLPFASPFSCPL